MGLFNRNEVDDSIKDGGLSPEQVEKASRERREKSTTAFRTLAGAYLCYLAYSIGKNLITGAEDPGNLGWLMWIAAAVFAGIGIWLVVVCALKYYREYSDKKNS